MKENKTSKFSAILGKVGLSPISLVAFIVLGLSPLFAMCIRDSLLIHCRAA